jgi:hypothetical protein
LPTPVVGSVANDEPLLSYLQNGANTVHQCWEDLMR